MANGIMDLPQGQLQQPQMPVVSSADAYDATTTALGNIDPAQLQQYKAAIQQSIAQLQMTPEQIDQMIQVFEYLIQNKERYPEALQQLVQQGILEAGDLPDQFDAKLMGVILIVLQELKARGGAQQPQMPSQFAEGGLADAARYLQNQGRNGDSILAHITPQEAAMLEAMGGSGTINPHTGLPEYFFKSIAKAFSGAVKSVVNVAKDIVQSPIGQIVGTLALATVIGPTALGATLGSAGTMALASAGTTLIAGGSLKDALVSGATSMLGAGISNYVGGMLPGGTPPWLASALGQAASGSGIALLQGKSGAEALKAGATGALVGGVTNQFMPKATSAPVQDINITDAMSSQIAGPNAPGSVGGTGNAANINPDLIAARAPAPLFATDLGNQAAAEPLNALINRDTGQLIQLNDTNPNAPASSDALNRAVASASDWTKDYQQTGPNAPAAPREGIAGLMDTAQEYGTKAWDYAKANPLTTAAGVTALAYGLGAGKPSEPKPDPLYKPQTGQDYINANPQIFGQYKSFGEPGTAAPTTTGFVPTVGPQPRGLATLQSAPLYTPPTAAITGGQPLNQPYNVAGMYRIPVYNRANGGPINNPMFSGTHPTGMTSAFASGGQYPRRSGAIDGPGTGTSDSIPAMLSDGEFVFTAKAVRNAGGGSRRAGAKKMYQLMQKLERGGKVQGA